MRTHRLLAATGATALAVAAMSGAVASSANAAAPSTSARLTATSATGASSYVVLAKAGVSATDVAARLAAAGATVTSVNTDVGMVMVTSSDAGFAASAAKVAGVKGAVRDRSIGQSPDGVKAPSAKPDDVTRENRSPGQSGPHSAWTKKGFKGAGDPLDDQLWGMDMINAPAAHKTEMGDKRVLVGVIDTGIQGDHPDLAPNFDAKLSRNFTTDIPEIDGPCAAAGCADPANVDDGGHGTHVAGTIAAAMNGVGVSGVAPDVTLVNVRAGQDSGYFFLGPTVNALTYSGDAGIDVVNMSFYVDPWLYNCSAGAPQDAAFPEAVAEQQLIIEAMTRALNYAHSKGVTLVGALGNNHEDLSKPRTDVSSPDYDNPAYTWDDAAYARTIDNKTCFDLPVEGPHVIGVSALGPSTKKADFSNYATDLASGEIEVSAPGGWFRDFAGTPQFRSNSNLILSTAPTHVMIEEGSVAEDGSITPDGEALGVQKSCSTSPTGVESCGYYQFLQGTSMAAPHATGVVALLISAHGKVQGKAGFGMDPDAVRSLLMSSATKTACPSSLITYADALRPAEFNASCVGTADFNSIYGAGIVNALGAVS